MNDVEKALMRAAIDDACKTEVGNIFANTLQATLMKQPQDFMQGIYLCLSVRRAMLVSLQLEVNKGGANAGMGNTDAAAPDS